MMSKLVLVILVSIQLWSVVSLSEIGEESTFIKYDEDQDLDLISDPNYRMLASWYNKEGGPENHPKETWRDVLAELSFGPSLKERMEESARSDHDTDVSDLPESFDARKKWKKCKRIIGTIHDEGNCVSDYAITAASVLADRLCIQTNGKFKALLSSQKVLGCYGSCNGGLIYKSFEHINNYGVPTGGLFKPKRGCVPYEHEPCLHGGIRGDIVLDSGMGALPNCSSITPTNSTCPTACTNKKYKKKFDADTHKSWSFGWAPTYEEKIKRIIYEHGPVGAAFAMYSDFKKHKKGIYWRSNDGVFKSIHKVKLIGWGKEGDTRYWLAVNSYNKNWGEKGLFKIVSGRNYLFIEALVVDSIPQDKAS